VDDAINDRLARKTAAREQIGKREGHRSVIAIATRLTLSESRTISHSSGVSNELPKDC